MNRIVPAFLASEASGHFSAFGFSILLRKSPQNSYHLSRRFGTWLWEKRLFYQETFGYCQTYKFLYRSYL
ncbi:hypothetical protein GV828_03990 [Flavobacterium sp. NST-5]|uniref:Uncharacterized protein n=1 Tax=Flavobacterium ichthyis TaxID=2698827 RepID=A0ABW9ZAM0_9FLAO|nr:hypothetical protein [Flavobacterium ichthyis]NBL64362.1 hypothetical protein [Flavobacterium ichthyis]